MRPTINGSNLLRTLSIYIGSGLIICGLGVELYAASAVVELSNGSRVRGELVKQDEQHLTVKVFMGAYVERKFPIKEVKFVTIDGKRHDFNAQTAYSVSDGDGGKSAVRPNLVTASKAEPPRASSWSWGYMGFRNDHNGQFPTADPPTSWNVNNAFWSVKLNGKSNASAVYTNDRVICCEEPDTLVCIEKSTGKVLWKKSNGLADAGASGTPHSPSWISTYGWTSPTPITNGQFIWASFGHGVCVCYDMEGNRKWIKHVAVSGRHHGTSASGCLVDGVFVVYMANGSGGSYYAFDALTGNQKWSSKQVITQGGLLPVRLGAEGFALSSGGTMFNAQSGAIKYDKINQYPYEGDESNKGFNWGASVIVHDNIAYFSNHYNPGNGVTGMVAVDLDSGKPRWFAKTGGRMGASPVLVDGLIYQVPDKIGLLVLDAKDGKEVYQQKMGSSYSSLVRAGAYIFCMGKNGKITVFKPGRTFQQVSNFDSGFTSSISSLVFDGKLVYFRDDKGLHCIAKP